MCAFAVIQELTEDPQISGLSRHQGSWTPNRVLGGLFTSLSSFAQKPFEATPSILGPWDCQKQDAGQGSLHHHRSQVPVVFSLKKLGEC